MTMVQQVSQQSVVQTQAEFDKQHRKIVSALKSIDADVYGLMEIANNGYGPNSAIAHLTSALGQTGNMLFLKIWIV